MTPENFEDFCKDICPHCKAGVVTRVRQDTGEVVHDGSIEIAGMLGRRQSHAFCLASNFRKKYGPLVGKQSGQ